MKQYNMLDVFGVVCWIEHILGHDGIEDESCWWWCGKEKLDVDGADRRNSPTQFTRLTTIDSSLS
jgi:hypothetical protein